MSQEMEDRYLHMRRDRDRLDVQLDRVQKELQQATDYYTAYQMVGVREEDSAGSAWKEVKCDVLICVCVCTCFVVCDGL